MFGYSFSKSAMTFLYAARSAACVAGGWLDRVIVTLAFGSNDGLVFGDVDPEQAVTTRAIATVGADTQRTLRAVVLFIEPSSSSDGGSRHDNVVSP